MPTLPVAPLSFEDAIGTGLLYPDFQMVTKFGRNPSIDNSPASTPEDIWNGGGVYTGHPINPTAETVEVFSASAEDGAGTSTGALTLFLDGLDANWEYQSDTVTLNGTSAVPTTKTWTRVNRAYVLTAGSTGSNVGAITIRHTTTTANVFAVMPALLGRTQIGAYTIPAGHVGYILSGGVSIARASGALGSATALLQVRPFAAANPAWQSVASTEVTTAAGIERRLYWTPVTAKADIRSRIQQVSDNATIATSHFEIVLRKL